MVRYGRAIHLKLRSVWTYSWRYRTAVVHGYATCYLSECRFNLYVTQLSPGVMEWPWLGFYGGITAIWSGNEYTETQNPINAHQCHPRRFWYTDVRCRYHLLTTVGWHLSRIYSDRRLGRLMKGPVSDEDGGLLIRPMAIGMRVPTMIRWDKGVGEICIRAGPIGRNTEWSGETKPVVAFLAGQGTSRYL